MKIKVKIKTNEQEKRILPNPIDTYSEKVDDGKKAFEDAKKIEILADKYINEAMEFEKKEKIEKKNKEMCQKQIREKEIRIQKKEEIKKNNSIPWRNYLVYFLILTSLSACMTFSKYVASVKGYDEAIIAKFEVKMMDTSLMDNGKLYYENGTLEDIVFDGFLNKKTLTYDKAFKIVNNSDVVINVSFENVNVYNNQYNVQALFVKNGIEAETMQLGMDETVYVKLIVIPPSDVLETNSNMDIVINAEQVD